MQRRRDKAGAECPHWAQPKWQVRRARWSLRASAKVLLDLVLGRVPCDVRRSHGLQTLIDAPVPPVPQNQCQEARGLHGKIPEWVST